MKMPILYALKSFIPRPMQIRIRQVIARRKRKSVGDVWPILESAGTPPPGWKGWPDGKQFALVLTHDVETAGGVERCREIMDLEERLGFRSVFYFVPDRYHVPADLRAEIIRRGFEIGVHGLRHDFTLFRSQAEFTQQAPEINRHIKEWGAVGFRAPYMIRNLDWIRDGLNLQYDASTFDTDPFEPQPEGVGTIFPFFVAPPPTNLQTHPPTHSQKHLLELPYTLCQDHNLFVLFGETTTDVWKTKLDWIVSHGGMAMLGTHPDYMQSSAKLASDEYPLRLYEEFLEHVRTRYAGQYWQALPCEVASFCNAHPERVRQGVPRRACMVSYSFYEADARVMRYAQTLIKAGYSVDAIALGKPGQPRFEEINNVQVERVQTRRRDERGKFAYLFRMLRFLFASSAALVRKSRFAPYDLVHVHSVPDFLVFSARRAKRRGARVILDLHDIVPEFYASKFGVSSKSLIFSLLLFQERLSCRFADHVISANDLWHDVITGRSVPPERCTSFVNNVDSTIFHTRKRTRHDGRFVLVYPGGMQKHQGLDVAIRAMPAVLREVPQAEFHLYGDGNQRQALAALIRELHLDQTVFLHQEVPLSEVPEIMVNSDLGIVPKFAEGFGNEAYSTKILEFMSQGLPVVASRTRIDQHYFPDGQVCFFESGNAADLAVKICELAKDPERRKQLARKGLEHSRQNIWANREKEYVDLVERLVRREQGKVFTEK